MPVFMRFILSSLLASGIDFAFFSGTFYLTAQLAISMAAGKISSGIVMFLVNKKFVFKSKDDAWHEARSFIALVFALSALTYTVIHLLHTKFGWSVYLAKAITDSAIFVANFLFQKVVVFHYSRKRDVM